MPDITIVEQSSPGFYGPYLAGDNLPPSPPVSPMVISEPGLFRRRLPPDVTTFTIEWWSGGGPSAAGTGGAGGAGGASGAHIKVTCTAPAYHPGDVLTMTNGDGGKVVGPAAGGASLFALPSGVIGAAFGSDTGNAPGNAMVFAAAGVTTVASNNGVNPAAAVGTTGGTGGTAPGTGGGAGGAGGTNGVAGAAGHQPGGGAGGGGGTSAPGANGGAGKFIITW